MIKFKEVTVTYNNKVTALDRVSFHVTEGEFVGIIGLSGSGKSTLLKTINGLVPLTSGDVFYKETPVHTNRLKTLREVRKEIGFVFQDFNLINRSSVLENVLLGRLGFKSSLQSMLGLFNDEDYALAIDALSQVGLSEKMFSRADQLSGGQKQRVAIAKTLAQKPTIILADEPVASLDMNSTEIVMNHFKSINQSKNITILMNLHDVALGKAYCSRIIALKNGRLYFDKKVGEIHDRDLHMLYQQTQ